MIATYNYPGASTFRAVYFPRTSEGKRLARDWWQNIHESNGPCAPGGGQWASDRVASGWKYRDGSKVLHEVPSVLGGFVCFNRDQF